MVHTEAYLTIVIYDCRAFIVETPGQSTLELTVRMIKKSIPPVTKRSILVSTPQVVPRFFQNFFLDFRIVRMLLQDVVTDVNGVHKPLGLHVVESQLVPDGRVALLKSWRYLVEASLSYILITDMTNGSDKGQD
jgi:hypothetical protein